MKKLLGLLGLAVAFILPLNVKAADEFKYTISCDKDSVPTLTEIITCDLKLVPDASTQQVGISANTSGFSIPLTFDNITDFTIITKDTNRFAFTSGANDPNIMFTIPNHFENPTGANIPLLTFTVRIAGNDKDCGKINYDGGPLTIEHPISSDTSIENPTNGAFAPYAVLAVAVVSAFGIFSIVKKNQKMYKL